MDYVLKRIHADGIAAALEKADRYRELNQPAEAESICRDVLALDPEHQGALRMLGLALTDQFQPESGPRFREAEAVFARLRDQYERTFYGGLACERQAKAQLGGHLPPRAVRPLFDRALARYAEAELIRPPGNDDPILRWNSCVRALHALPGGHPEPDADAVADADVIPLDR